MKIALYYHEFDANTLTPLKAKLEELGYTLLPFKMADEIEQLVRQAGMTPIIFTDSKNASGILKERDGKTGESFNVLFLPKQPVIKPETKSQLDQLRLRIYSPSTMGQFENDLDRYCNKDDKSMVDLQFALPPQNDEDSE